MRRVCVTCDNAGKVSLYSQHADEACYRRPQYCYCQVKMDLRGLGASQTPEELCGLMKYAMNVHNI